MVGLGFSVWLPGQVTVGGVFSRYTVYETLVVHAGVVPLIALIV